MSWISIKNKSIPPGKRNVVAITLAVNAVAAMPNHASCLAQIGKSVLVAAIAAVLLVKSLQYTYGDLVEDMKEAQAIKEKATQNLVVATLRAVCLAID
jgi:hypothetical protein